MDDLESAVECVYEGHGAEARDGNGPREVVASWGERLTRISAEITDVKRAAVVVVVFHIIDHERINVQFV